MTVLLLHDLINQAAPGPRPLAPAREASPHGGYNTTRAGGGPTVMRIGFIGLGKMGSAMARNLLCAGHQVAAYNRSRQKAEALAGDGARVADSTRGCLPRIPGRYHHAGRAIAPSKQIVFGENGVPPVLARGAVHISSSTIGRPLARRLAAEHAQRGQGYLSAPVFGVPRRRKAES